MKNDQSESCDPFAMTQIDRPVPAAITARPGGGASGREVEPTQVRYFGTYELLGEIARGGMGVVYKARQNTLNRTVAIKVILGGKLASQDEVKRFLVEAEAAANLNHPGIVPVYEFGEHDGTHYFSMAYIDGPSLAEEVASGPLDAEKAVELLAQITEAVAYAHGQGVIHRDLKPSNILLEKGEIPRIADFGLAKRIEDDSDLTHTGTIMGSVYYMPPEQAAGRNEDVGPASDVYALGAILYKLLTGRPPFQAATGFETMQQVISDEPVPPRQLNSGIPRDLETICLKCLEKDVGRRYGSARALGDELNRFREGRPILARPLGRTARLWRWFKRYPVPATLGAALVLALLVGAVTAGTLWSRAESEHRLAQEQQRMVGVLSGLVLKKTLDETDEWLRLFFQPVEQELLVARAWGKAGLLDKERPEDLNAMLGPIIRHYPQVSSLMVADGRGREHMLLCVESRAPGSGEIEREWKNRMTRRDEWGDQVHWSRWSDRNPTPEMSVEALPDYDPRIRPWYREALCVPPPAGGGNGTIHWTVPYVFFTTKDLGITASVRFERPDGLDHVVAFDVLLKDITKFTTSKLPTDNGKVLVLTEDQEMIGLPHADTLKGPEDWKSAFLQKPGDLGLEAVARAAAQFTFTGDAPTAIRQFEDGGLIWWAGVRPFRLGAGNRLWILVLVPESDLREDLATAGEVAGFGAVDP